ncbi:MAG: CcoQ/FixQ family Cbb3-type cytochrome c oxidase assembly chaperone [Gammaproteobacteria bacterium]
MEATVIDMGLVRGVATVFALLAFLAVVAWAYGKRSQEAFRSAAQLPLEEDDGSEIRS